MDHPHEPSRRADPCRASGVPALAAAAVLWLSASAAAEEVTQLITGRVTIVNVPETAAPGTADLLLNLGVAVDAPVTLSFTVESTTPGQVIVDPYTTYVGAVVGYELSVGGYVAVLDPEALSGNSVQVGNDVVIPPKSDSYTVAALGDEPRTVLKGSGPFDVLVFNAVFADADGKTISNEAVVQDASRFTFGSGAVGGLNGTIAFALDLDGGGPVFDPTALARQGQLKAASKFGSSVLAAEARFAKAARTVDPQGDKLAAAIGKAEDKFGAQFVKAVEKALQKGGSAPLPASALDEVSTGLRAGFDTLADTLLAGVVVDDKDDRVLRGKLLSAAAKQLGAEFAAHAKHAKKPVLEKLEAKLASSRAALLKAAQKALDAAAAKGVAYGGPSPDELADAVSALVDEFVALTQG